MGHRSKIGDEGGRGREMIREKGTKVTWEEKEEERKRSENVT